MEARRRSTRKHQTRKTGDNDTILYKARLLHSILLLRESGETQARIYSFLPFDNAETRNSVGKMQSR